MLQPPRAARRLQFIMLTDLLIAAFPALLMVLLISRSRQEAKLREARQQTADILRTVKEGVFLLDEHLVIGTEHSSALEALFQRKDLAGLGFEDLLKGIVSGRTLVTALTFVELLWAEPSDEKPVKSINPLREVEVQLALGGGKFDTRYLEFEFHRVRYDGKITHLLVSVSDVTSRVELARERQNSQKRAQIDPLLGIRPARSRRPA
jgi:PAS domain-containing protein